MEGNDELHNNETKSDVKEEMNDKLNNLGGNDELLSVMEGGGRINSCKKKGMKRLLGFAKSESDSNGETKPYIREAKIDEIVDPSIKGGYHAEAMWRILEVALSWVEPFSRFRPEMEDVVHEVEDALIIENNASEYMKLIESLGGSNRYSILIEKRARLPTPSTTKSTITTQNLSFPQPR